MGFPKLCLAGLTLLSALVLCAGCGGGAQTKPVTTTPTPAATDPTLGQGLRDLESAYEKGAISQQEYELRQMHLLGRGAED